MRAIDEFMTTNINQQNKDLQEMKETINDEMKDMKSANCQFGFEIERNQNLFRQM